MLHDNGLDSTRAAALTGQAKLKTESVFINLNGHFLGANVKVHTGSPHDVILMLSDGLSQDAIGVKDHMNTILAEKPRSLRSR